MDVTTAQQRLTALGYSVGAIDGDIGPKTYTGLINYAVGKNLGERSVALGRALSPAFKTYLINNPLRILHFISQAAHETGGFKYLEELGGPSYFKKYDGRSDLGNIEPGDGNKYHGRGIFQLTGRANYKYYGDKLGINLVKNPERAAEPEISCLIACIYWSGKALNSLADRDDCRKITRAINGGYNGYDDRLQYVNKLKKILL